MRHVVSFARFWWEFIVGDDWRIAAGLAVALGLCALLVHEAVAAWWLLPLAALALLAESLRRATRSPAEGEGLPRRTQASLSSLGPARLFPFVRSDRRGDDR
jgi:hypothetical protein